MRFVNGGWYTGKNAKSPNIRLPRGIGSCYFRHSVPGVSKRAKERDPRTLPSNLKQLGLAIVQYTQDSDGMMPNVASANSTDWRTAIYPYEKWRKIYQDSEREEESKDGSDGFSQDYAANYTGNYGQTQPDKGEGAFAGPGSYLLSVNGFLQPNQVIELVEVENNNRPEFNIDDARLFGPNAKKLWAGHESGDGQQRGRSNYLFVDGHVKALRPLQTHQTDSSGKVLVNLWYQDGKKPLSSDGVAVLKDAQTRFK